MKLYQKPTSYYEKFTEFLPEDYYYAGKIIVEGDTTVVVLLPKEYRSKLYHWVDVTSRRLNAFGSNDVQYAQSFVNDEWKSEFYQFDTAKEMYTWVVSQI